MMDRENRESFGRSDGSFIEDAQAGRNATWFGEAFESAINILT